MIIDTEGDLYQYSNNNGYRDAIIRRVELPLHEKVLSVKTSISHTVIVAESGVYTFGYGRSGVLGTGNEGNVIIPTLVVFDNSCVSSSKVRVISVDGEIIAEEDQDDNNYDIFQ